MATLAAAAIWSAGPIAVFFANSPDVFAGRFRETGVFQTGWLDLQAAATGLSRGTLLWMQLRDSLSTFVATPAYDNFFNYPAPHLTLLASGLVLIGMGVSFLRIRQVESLILLVWFWAVVLIGGMLTVSPPANTRLVMTTPALALFVAVGLRALATLVTRLGFLSVRQAGECTFAVVLAGGAYGVAFYSPTTGNT